MRIVIAPDSFKECLGAIQVAEAMARGVRRAVPKAEVVCKPMADGGEGSVDALLAAVGEGERVEVEVTDPMGSPVRAVYGLIDGGQTAVIEMAAASGLGLVRAADRRPGAATSRGTGELMCSALGRGVRRMIVGIGGSATNDAGAGMAQALGWRLLNEKGEELGPGGLALRDLAEVDGMGRDPRLDGCEVLVACDVRNPLCGPEGASRVYGPQKGAGPGEVDALDEALHRFGEVVEQRLGVSVATMPGAGAAGGMGAGLHVFAGGRLCEGVELVAEACGLRESLEGADLVITGEGRIDVQTTAGKTPVGVAGMAKVCGVPVVALAGGVGARVEALRPHGIDAVLSIADGPVSLDEAMGRAEELLEEAAENAVRIWCARRRT